MTKKNTKHLLNEIKRLERENLDLYKDMIRIQKRLQHNQQRIYDIVYQYGYYCLHKLGTNECDIAMLFRWYLDYKDVDKIIKELTDRYNRMQHTYQNNQVIIKDLKIEAGVFPSDIQWVSRNKLPNV